MSGENEEDRMSKASVKLPKFSGKKKQFNLWWLQIRSYGAVYKFHEALKDTLDDLPWPVTFLLGNHDNRQIAIELQSAKQSTQQP